MRRNEFLIAKSIGAAACLFAGAVFSIQAQTRATAPQEVLSAPAQPQGAPADQASLAKRASMVNIGQNTAGSLKEIADLQRELTTADLRKRIRELEGGTAQAPSQLAALPPLPGAALSQSAAPLAPIPQTPVTQSLGAPKNEQQQPQAEEEHAELKVVSIVITQDRSRADLMLPSGVVKTVKAGDTVEGWTVSSIRHGEVVAEMMGSKKPGTPQTLSKKLKLWEGTKQSADAGAVAGVPVPPLPSTDARALQSQPNPASVGGEIPPRQPLPPR